MTSDGDDSSYASLGGGGTAEDETWLEVEELGWASNDTVELLGQAMQRKT